MELYQLKSFAAVAREGNLTRAADKVFSSQSAVSGHIKALEDELGVRLFARTPRGMELTAPGRALLERAQTILDAAEAMAQQATSLRGEVRGALRVSVNTDFSYLRLAAIGRKLAAKWPELEVHYLLSQSHLTPGLVQTGEVDMGFCFGHWRAEEVKFISLAATPLRIIGPPEWEARLAAASLEEMLGMPWITNPTSCPIAAITSSVFQKHGRLPRVAAVSDSEDVLAELASQGLGVTVIKESDAVTLAAMGKVSLWPAPFSELTLSLAVLATRLEDPAPKAFLQEATAVWWEEEEAPACDG